MPDSCGGRRYMETSHSHVLATMDQGKDLDVELLQIDLDLLEATSHQDAKVGFRGVCAWRPVVNHAPHPGQQRGEQVRLNPERKWKQLIMVEAPWDCHRHGKHQEPSSICYVLGLGKDGSSPMALDDNNGGACRLGHRSVVGLGLPCPGKDPSDPWIDPAGQDNACKSKSSKNQGPRRRKARGPGPQGPSQSPLDYEGPVQHLTPGDHGLEGVRHF